MVRIFKVGNTTWVSVNNVAVNARNVFKKTTTDELGSFYVHDDYTVDMLDNDISGMVNIQTCEYM